MINSSFYLNNFWENEGPHTLKSTFSLSYIKHGMSITKSNF